MKVKVTELSGAALDWAVANATGDFTPNKHFDDEGNLQRWVEHYSDCRPSTDWSQGGPLIEREKIAIDFDHDVWNASKYDTNWYISGPTPLIAAMRCYVRNKLGDEVDIPDALSGGPHA